ncbi:MAG: glycosyltransferase family 4 protein, partial [Eubacteriales bacterium]
NIPSPYRIDFFNALGKYVDLTVIFEAKKARGLTFNYNLDQIQNFKIIFLSDGHMDEKKVDLKILPYLRRGVYDKIIVTNYGFATEAAGIFALKIKKIPYEMELDGGVLRRENPLIHRLKRMLVRGATRYWSTGEQTDAFFRHFGIPDERIVRYPFTSVPERNVVSHVPTREEKQALRKKLDIPYANMVLGVGQMIYRKGFDLLIQVADRMPASTGIYIVGGEPPEAWLKFVEERNLRNVHFVAFKGEAQLNEYYRAADVFVLPTREDIWGLVVNEAMANALPVVTTDACGAGVEMIRDGENGFLIPSDSSELLAERILRLLSDDTLRERIAVATLETAKRYTIEEMARVHVDLLNKD